MTTNIQTPKGKLFDMAGSSNVLVSIITLFILALNLNGASIPEGAAHSIADAFASQNMIAIISVLVPNLVNPILKIIRAGGWSFDRIKKSMNFWTQAATVVLAGISGFGIAFPDGAAAEIVNAISIGDFGVIAIAFVINVINPLYHYFFDKK